MIKKLFSLLTIRDKQLMIGLAVFSILISGVETIGVSAIMPFIAVTTDSSIIHSDKYFKYFYTLFNFENDVMFIVAFGVGLVCFYLFRSLINLIYLFALYRFTHGRYHLITDRLFKKYMEMPYQLFTSKNSSVLTKSIINEAYNLTVLISSLLMIMSEFFVVICIYSLLLAVNYKVTIILTFLLAANAILMIKTVSAKIKEAGAAREKYQRIFYEIINRSLGNFKLIKLQANDKEVSKAFSTASYNYAKANISNATLGQVPRLFLEAFGFSLIILVICYLIWQNGFDVSTALSLISLFVLALFRLMPSVNRIMNSYNGILFYKKSLDIVYTDMFHESEVLGDKDITFSKEIVIQNLWFEYDKAIPVLEDVNLIINKGTNIAFIGESGSGKSTIVDLIIGLYRPRAGKILVDDIQLDDSNIKTWRKNIGYIPQMVYLFDGTVGQNVALGAEYDSQKVDECLKKAKIYDFLAQKDGQNTLVGEGGIMLSGGQKQRIAIARALYKDPDIIVFDEATSALDDETEKEIMDEIYAVSHEKTLIIIAHRLSTIDRCDKVYKLDNHKILQTL